MVKRNRPAIVISRIIEFIEILSGGFLALVFGVSLLYELSLKMEDGFGLTAVLAVFMLIGAILLWRGFLRKRLRKNFRRYVMLGSASGDWSFEGLANMSGESVEVVRRQLSEMVHRHFFGSAYLDGKRNRLVFPDMPQEASPEAGRNGRAAGQKASPAGLEEAEAGMVAVTCRHCGATKLIRIGRMEKCDYCQSALSAKDA